MHIIFSREESFFYIRARERASEFPSQRSRRESISTRNFFADAIHAESRGRKKGTDTA